MAKRRWCKNCVHLDKMETGNAYWCKKLRHPFPCRGRNARIEPEFINKKTNCKLYIEKE